MNEKRIVWSWHYIVREYWDLSHRPDKDRVFLTRPAAEEYAVRGGWVWNEVHRIATNCEAYRYLRTVSQVGTTTLVAKEVREDG